MATLGLLLVIFGPARSKRLGLTPFAVGAYITGAYFFTSSTSFANPAVSVARELSNTFAGISPGSVAPFVVAELVGSTLAWLLIRTLYPTARDVISMPSSAIAWTTTGFSRSAGSDPAERTRTDPLWLQSCSFPNEAGKEGTAS